MIDWHKIVEELMSAGLTQVQIAEECGVAQSTVSELRKGSSTPRYDFGARLLQLHRDRTSGPSERPTAEAAHG